MISALSFVLYLPSGAVDSVRGLEVTTTLLLVKLPVSRVFLPVDARRRLVCFVRRTVAGFTGNNILRRRRQRKRKNKNGGAKGAPSLECGRKSRELETELNGRDTAGSQ